MRTLTIFLAVLLLQMSGIARAEDRTGAAIDRLCLAYKLNTTDGIALRNTLRDAARTRDDVRRGLFFYETAWKLLEDYRRSRERTLLDAIALYHDRDLHAHLADLSGCYHADVLPAVNYANAALFTTQGQLTDQRFLDGSDEAHYRLRRSYEVYRRLGYKPQDSYAMAVEDRGGRKGEVSTLESRLLSLGRLILTGYDALAANRDAFAFLESWYAYNNPSAADIKGVRPVQTPFDFMNLRVADGILRDNQTMIRPVRAIIDRVLHDTGAEASSAPDARGHDVRALTVASSSLPVGGSSPLGEPPPFDQIGLPLWLADSSGWQRSEWTDRAATNIPFMSGHEQQGPWWKLRQPDGMKISRLNKISYAKAGSRIVFYIWWWGTGSTSAFFAAGNSEKTVPLEGRFSLGASSGKVIRVELIAPKPDDYGRIWIHFSASGKFALAVAKIYDQVR